MSIDFHAESNRFSHKEQLLGNDLQQIIEQDCWMIWNSLKGEA
jgi:hypothetical protein